MGILEYIFGESVPEVDGIVVTKDTLEIGRITEVQRSGGGFFETFATCTVKLASGSERTLIETGLKRL